MLVLTEQAEIHDKLLPGGSTKSSLWYPSTWISSLCCSAGMRKKLIQLRIFRLNGDNAAMKISSTTYPGCIHDNMLYFTVLKKKMKRSLTKAVVNIVTMQLRIALIQPACGSISIDAMQS